MHKNNIPAKVAIGYCIIALILISAICLVYVNTKSIIAINKASQEYLEKKNIADSTITALLKEEQRNLQQLSDAMAGKSANDYLHDKMKNLSTGKDSVVVHSKSPQTHKAKNITVEVMKTRKGFFRRLADAFRKERAETLSIKQDSNMAVVDSVGTPVNVAENVADILQQIEKKENNASRNHARKINKEIEGLKIVSAQLALRSANQLNDVHQKERDSMQQAINKAMKARSHLLWQMALLALVTLFAIVVLVALIWRDIKKERIYRENLEAANEEIQRVMSQRERLLLTITHDIKAPAASITGFIDLMKDYIVDPKGTEYLNNIKNSALHLSHLVASLLDFHLLENGLMKVNPTMFSPARMIAESVEAMNLKAKEKRLNLSCNIVMGDEMFKADAFRIRQILDNLLSNAIKYTDHGSVTIHAQISKVMDSQQLQFSVTDTGKGMDEMEQREVFQAFTRLKSAQGIEGTGLGLSITKELVTLLGGELHLHSVVSKGSTFTVSIPLELCSVEKEKEETRNTFANDKILILDDDKLQLRLIQEMLHQLVGSTWQVFACNQAVEALTVLHNERPALMLMDIEMPEMDGIEMIKHINHAQMTVVAMTAHDTSIKDKLLEAGFDDCLFKPFGIDKLAKILGCESRKAFIEPVSNTQSFLDFAGGDEEVAREILSTVRQDLTDQLAYLEKARKKEPLPVESIGKAIHKLTPIASMMHIGCMESLTALSATHIQELEESQIRELLDIVTRSLRQVLSK